jgi:hypothetical protein
MPSKLLSAIFKFDKQAAPRLHDDGTKKPTESKELKDYKNDDYPRASSESVKGIAKLYNVRHESYDYKDNIMESAHPDKLILLPAYDKLNGLVENHMERQKINLNIMRKPVSGLEYRQKYAELLKALLKTANDMDFQKQEQLSTLADSTVIHLQKEALGLEDLERWFGEKATDAGDVAGGAAAGGTLGTIAGGLIGAFGGLGGAWAGAKIGGIAGTALGGVVSAIFKTGPVARSVQQNAKVAADKVNALIKDHPNDMFLSELATSLSHIQDTAIAYANLTTQMQATTANPGLHSMSGHNPDEGQVMQLGQQYIAEIQKLDNQIDVFRANVKEGKYAPEESDWVSKVKSPFRGMVGDAVHDADEAVATLERVAEAAVDGIRHAKAQAQSLSGSSASEPGESEIEQLQKLLSGKYSS